MQLSLGLAETGLLTLKRANAMRLPTSPKHQPNQLTPRHGSPVAFFMGNAMETYNHQEAAQLLKCSPRRVSALCRDGLIAANKAGKTWCITDAALAAYLGSTHNSQRDSVARMESACQSSNAVKHGGDRTPHQAANELELRLKQLTKRRPKKSLTKSAMTCGGKSM